METNKILVVKIVRWIIYSILLQYYYRMTQRKGCITRREKRQRGRR